MEADEPAERKHSFVAALQSSGASVSVRSLMSFRVKYLQIAEAAADSLTVLEGGQAPLRWYDEAFQRAVVAIVFSYSAAEAAMNEAMRDLKIKDPLYSLVERQSPIDQANSIAAIQGFDQFLQGEKPITSMSLLKAVRDGLIHPKAEWSNDRALHAKLSKRISSAGIPVSPFAEATDRVFPIACMSAGMAAWAAKSARQFIYRFYERAGLPHSG